jgi:hypothetical protein
LSSNPVVTSNSSVDRIKEILKTVTDAARFVEELLGGMGVGANAGQVERLIEAFANLAAIAIQAAHSVSGQAITPESVKALLPVNTPLVAPAK